MTQINQEFKLPQFKKDISLQSMGEFFHFHKNVKGTQLF